MTENTAANDAGMQVIDSTQTDNATVNNDTGQQTEEGKINKTQDAAANSVKRTRTKEYSDRINKIRNEAAQKTETLNNELAKYKNLEKVLKDSGYKGNNAQELAYEIMAQNEGISIEEARRAEQLKQAEQRRLINESPEVIKAKEIIKQAALDNDLKMIKQAYPDVDVQSPLELGETFISLMATGRIDALTAYEAQLAMENRNKKPVPPSTGDIKTTGSAEKDYFTSAEVDKLPESAYDDPKIMKKIRASMLRWKK